MASFQALGSRYICDTRHEPCIILNQKKVSFFNLIKGEDWTSFQGIETFNNVSSRR